MSTDARLIDIPVISEPAMTLPSMNVEPILHEVRHALRRLLETGETAMIDLRAMPLAPGEEAKIRERLGTGEVVIRLDAMGPSTLTETAYSGVWWVEHRNPNDVVTGLYIEVAKVPSIVEPDRQDLIDAVARLNDDLENNDDE